MQNPAQPNSKDVALQAMSAVQSLQACILQLVQKDLGSENIINQLRNQITKLQEDIDTLQARINSDKKPAKPQTNSK